MMLLWTAVCAAQDLTVANGGFENLDGTGQPAGWGFGCSDKCHGVMRVDNACKAGGERSVCLSSDTEYAPHVYCGLARQVGPLTPGVRYRFSLKAKGEEVGSCWFGGGPGWNARLFLPSESFDWEAFHVDWTCPEGVTSFEFRINVDSVTDALWIDDVQVTVAPPELPEVPDAELADKTLAAIAEQEARLAHLEALLAQAQQDDVPVAYPRADLATARMFVQYCRDDVANGRIPRAAEVAREVGELLDRAGQEMRRGIDVPLLKSDSPVEIRDGSLWGTCTLGGREVRQPVFLTGYGHFQTVVEDLPLLARMGINVIQIEIGPSSIVFEDGARTDEIMRRVLPALDRARDNGARVCLLLSPHYFPQWAYEKWPELDVNKGGFLKVAVDAPQARDIYRKQIETLIPAIKDHPALQSICLSNEPVSFNSERDPFRKPLWRAFVERKHKTIAALNAAYGSQYGSFDEVPHPEMRLSEKPAALYDGVRFNQERFAEWHAWMTETIHGIAPELPCHAKVMLLPTDRGTVLWGTDPWDFARLSQMNGNDCPFLQAPQNSRWASEWSGQNLYYDLQRSMKRVPIFNTENHLIRDRDTAHIAGSHIYSAVWQGAVHGQGASTAWVWERSYDRKSDFEGSILHRPCCAAAMNRCALDLMRCAREVAALQNAVPRVAILYSHAATVWDPAYVGMRSRVYSALNFCGIPIGFITDEQIEAGLLGQYQCVLVTGAEHASRAAIEGMRRFAADGGTVLAYGPVNLVQDEYGHDAAPPPFAAVLETRKESQTEALRDALMEQLQTRGLGPEVVVKTPEGRLPWGLEWRTATLDGRRVINLVNYRKADVQVNLPEGKWTDLAACTPLANPVTLKADVPVLAVEGTAG